jgi:hypothetical protein
MNRKKSFFKKTFDKMQNLMLEVRNIMRVLKVYVAVFNH